jgi:hypothetical protein
MGVLSTRHIGIGDVQHIRHQLLSIGLLSKYQVPTQLEGAMLAAKEIGMMLRAHLRVDRLSEVERKEILALVFKHASNQVIEHSTRRLLFDSFAGTLDMVIWVDRDSDLSAKGVCDSLVQTWYSNDARFTRGNFGFLAKDRLSQLHPGFELDLDKAYERFIE